MKNLTRPKSAIEYAVYKRFKAACTAVGAALLPTGLRRRHPLRVQRAGARTRGVSLSLGADMDPSTVRDMDHKDLAFVAVRRVPRATPQPPPLVPLDQAGRIWMRDRAPFSPEGPLHLDEPFPALSDAPIRKSDNTDGDAVLLLEPDIKAHFVISRPTRAYQQLLDALPEHFVGTHKRLVQLVDFLCEQMLVSFRERGMSVPPWRKNKSILSKWFLPTATSRSHPASPTGSPETATRGAA